MAIENLIDKLRNKHHRLSMEANYHVIWRIFNEFFLRLDQKPDSWEERLTLFVGYLIDHNRKLSTIKSYISAIKSVLRDDGVILNENRYLIASLTQACRLKNDRVLTRLPIQKQLLNLLVKQLEVIITEQPYLLALYKAIFVTGYYGLFRIGELTLGMHPVLAKDVHISDNKRKLKFVLHTSKTHWRDSGPQVIRISNKQIYPSKRKLPGVLCPCPYQSLRNYMKVRQPGFIHVQEPFFVFKDRSPVQPEHVRQVLKKTIVQIGLDPAFYHFHSFRIGRATDLLAFLDVPMIKAIGRWRSNSVYSYLC